MKSLPKYYLIRFLVNSNSRKLIIVGITIYLSTAFLFSIFYKICNGISRNGLNGKIEFFDYIYFSFVTQTTIGYGDFYPTGLGKIVFILHSLIAITFFSTLIGVVVAKLFLPNQFSIHVSQYILHSILI